MDAIPKGTTNCMVCGNDISYHDHTCKAKCYYCGAEEDTYMCCESAHYVCDKCHSADALEIIESVCMSTNLKNPILIAEKIMAHPKMPMHGPEHHSLVPAALITAYMNYVGQKDYTKIVKGISRGQKVAGGFCGYQGACGGGIGAGIAISVLLDATPLTPEERSHANRGTSRSLEAIADAGGARCCKKATRISLREGMKYLSEMFGINWINECNTNVQCQYTPYNAQCDRDCVYRIAERIGLDEQASSFLIPMDMNN
ncbi:DUF5714 domain-containing protein [Methanococcoides cohabitans]|uniref:DUF5714 domain-containing protein n=1 Tax=Methanococcoides cohabitans TaxID=3136559 RepID=A0ABU9KSQ3_9EURY